MWMLCTFRLAIIAVLLGSYCLLSLHRFIGTYKSQRYHSSILQANPINSDGSNYGRDITEEEAFLWFDEALIYVRGGSGGEGSNTFRYGKSRQHLGPIGGSGGNGGSVILTVDESINTLLKFKGSASFKASNGEAGGVNFANGQYGENFYVAVPAGTTVRDNSTGEVIGELKFAGDTLEVAKGGLGGQGNAANKVAKGAKAVCSPPQGGERRWLKMELNLVADIGLVGVPNAGKSTLLDAITNARPKIASYPFTTIVPNLGVCDMGNLHFHDASGGKGSEQGLGRKSSVAGSGIVGQTMVIADIPGLLEGAHKGVGLGRGFLRHVERCKIIIHVVNGDSQDPIGDYTAINRELQLFSPKLAAKPQIVVLNKLDLPTVLGNQSELMTGLQASMKHTRLLPISAAGQLGLSDLVGKTWNFLKKIEMDMARQGEQAERIDTGIPEENGTGKVRVNDQQSTSTSGTLKANSAGPAFQVNCVSDDTVEVYGEAISAIISEHSIGDAYYGSTERFDAMLEAVGLSDAIYQALHTERTATPTTTTKLTASSAAAAAAAEVAGEGKGNDKDLNNVINVHFIPYSPAATSASSHNSSGKGRKKEKSARQSNNSNEGDAAARMPVFMLLERGRFRSLSAAGAE